MPAATTATLLALFALAAGGCSMPRTLVAPAPRVEEAAAPPAIESGFLSSYDRLTASAASPSLRVFRDGGTLERRRVHVRPVQIWRGGERLLDDVSEEDLQYLADALYRAIAGKVGPSLQIANAPGPGVLELHLAFTLATTAGSSADFFSAAVPVPFLARREGTLVEGTRRFLRSSALELEISESSMSRSAAAEVRLAIFDSRRGADSPKGSVETWEEVHAAFEKWAELVRREAAAAKAQRHPSFEVAEHR